MKRWTPEEWQKTKAMLDQGMDRNVVAKAIGRKLGCLKEKIRWEGMSAEQRAARLKHIREKRQAASVSGECAHKRRVVAEPFVCGIAAADRDIRKTIMPRDLSAAFFGDPLPGYSALDKRPLA
jgi:hypothetical protein